MESSEFFRISTLLFAPLTLRSEGVTLYFFIEHKKFYVLESVRTFLPAFDAEQSPDLLGQTYFIKNKGLCQIRIIG